MYALSSEAEVAAIQQIGLVLATMITAGFAYLGVQGDRTRRHAKASRMQVENSHSTNLRDELDERHAETKVLLTEHSHHLDRLDRRVGALEDTQPARPRPTRRRTS
ncbi:MAG: hypothetical protein CMF56_01325 [Leifsonia sp.]|nr:hypothetical protein [Leifsonia sp.]|tara:strand:- start:19494 stop:19811 length:318 start_codon:yes stop_codon:yes gene_type:complete